MDEQAAECAFLALPPEMRLLIYDFLFEDNALRTLDFMNVKAALPSSGILMTCRTIHTEAAGTQLKAQRKCWSSHAFRIDYVDIAELTIRGGFRRSRKLYDAFSTSMTMFRTIVSLTLDPDQPTLDIVYCCETDASGELRLTITANDGGPFDSPHRQHEVLCKLARLVGVEDHGA